MKKEKEKEIVVAPVDDGAENKESEIKEVTVAKPGLYQDCFVYYGVPIARFS